MSWDLVGLEFRGRYFGSHRVRGFWGAGSAKLGVRGSWNGTKSCQKQHRVEPQGTKEAIHSETCKPETLNS